MDSIPNRSRRYLEDSTDIVVALMLYETEKGDLPFAIGKIVEKPFGDSFFLAQEE